ncbi:MAG: hypothetical protein LC808_14720 [Actinobacteria bacterium]|nr:hypothetical protein [Actinomycetota bacterium]
MRTSKYLRVLLAVAALGLMLVAPQPASAHTSPYTRNGMIYGHPGFCVNGSVTQDHGWHSVGTITTDCRNAYQNWHRQYQRYYKGSPYGGPGEYCFTEGPHESPGWGEKAFSRTYTWDIWNWCNYGYNHYVRIYIDSWQAAWDPNYTGIGWREGAWRPATSHCHCP